MSEQWKGYSDKYKQLTTREQYLILLTGLVALFFIIFYLFIEPTLAANNATKRKIEQSVRSNKSLQSSIADLELLLQNDPNEVTKEKIAQFEAKLAKVDAKLLTLTSDLISPVQMRHALFDLLKLEKGVSLLSFELLGAEPLLALEGKSEDGRVLVKDKGKDGQNLYKHGIKVKLSGNYFALQGYLKQLELLSWKFFWQDFNFNMTEYPENELEIVIYSLSTRKEFVGV